MSRKNNPVNLDAMIPREDFAIESGKEAANFKRFDSIGVRELKNDSLILPLLRKPDFQRETNHWSPIQIVSLLECFVNGDLIPAVIVWGSSSYLFVVDGGHRLSAIRAWLLDDYGDGPVSSAYFGHAISKEQRRAAQATRELVDKSAVLGKWQHLEAGIQTQNLPEERRRLFSTAVTRGIFVQWVEGNADKAEKSFFKINTQGTPLDEIEQVLLECRHKPIPIAARAVIRAGMGHRYWSDFQPPMRENIEKQAIALHSNLFDPELNSPVKTLDLPLGGSKGIRDALRVLIEVMTAAVRDQNGLPAHLRDQLDDVDGSATINVLKKTFALVSRISGNDDGSLGLHPAIYFYGPTGRHVAPMFLGIIILIGRKLANHDKLFFAKFTSVRQKLEGVLIEHKDLIATVLQKTISPKRASRYADLMDALIARILENPSTTVTDGDIVSLAGLVGKIITGSDGDVGKHFNDETKSAVFIATALKSALKCPICGGYLDTTKSVSYDHVKENAIGGDGNAGNCQLTHPYCNQGVKNKQFQQT
jgi:hypothetical protein